MSRFTLTPGQRQEIEDRLTYLAEDAIRLRRRLLAVLLYDQGMPTRQVAFETGMSPGRARYWRRRFAGQGMAIFPGHPAPNSTRSEPPAAPGPLPFPNPMEEAGILPEDRLAEAGRKVMLFHFAEMLSHEAGTRLGEDIEELHDMRVATRRLRAAFDIFSQAFKPKAIKPHLKRLRATGRALGKARDLDVFIEKAQHYLIDLPPEERSGLDPLVTSWSEQRAAARGEMIAHLDSQEYDTFKMQFNLFLHTPGKGARLASSASPVPDRVREVAPVLIYTRLAAVRAYSPLLKNASLEQLHALRIEFKKLRYAVEFFREALGEGVKQVIQTLKGVQDHLGDLNDARVACDLLGDFLANWEGRQGQVPLAERQSLAGPAAYLAFRHAERHRLMVTFPETWACFDSPEFNRNLALAVAEL